MPSTVEKLSPSRVKLTVEIPFADLKPHLDKAYRDIAQSVTIPGFRKGKIPNMVIDQRFGRGAVLQEAINAALPAAFEAAVTEASVVPLGEPDVEVTRLEDGELIEFTAELDIRPEFTVADVTKLTATVEVVRSVDEEVAERLKMLQQRFATTTEVDRAAAEGDQITISLVGTRDGEPLPDATADDVNYIIGSGGMIDGLDDAVTGLAAGASAEFSSTLVGGPLEGEPADITVTVSKVSEQKLPEIDDEFASMISEFDTAEEMRADLAKGVAGDARCRAGRQRPRQGARGTGRGHRVRRPRARDRRRGGRPQGPDHRAAAARRPHPRALPGAGGRDRQHPGGVLGRGGDLHAAWAQGPADPGQGRRRRGGRRRPGRPVRDARAQGRPERLHAGAGGPAHDGAQPRCLPGCRRSAATRPWR